MANKNNFDINILVEISYQSQYLQNHLNDIRKKRKPSEGKDYKKCLYEKQSVKQAHIHLFV